MYFYILKNSNPSNFNDTIFYSQKLDELITRYQKLKMNNTQKFDQKSCCYIMNIRIFLLF
ncbi:Spo0E family sporulation regulatory protein-aspartic acid phosphatase [Bacillus sp. V3B]|uniref:Spo0E family sporulation regulatory protein-aspartic acid phosphatase n=1 Tax=Bacillus sp. V3B TaxID=2804915 RepID=UPI0035C6757B|nr:Spo0E family sporulation regulatory protein-aspartic acid phosphatase [Bacillus sp. V3B]